MNRLVALLAVAMLMSPACGSEGGNGDGCVSPLPGDLVITEVMVRPAGEGGQDGKEWIEVYNASTLPITMTGLQVKVQGAKTNYYPVTCPEGYTLASGGYVVLAGTVTGAAILPFPALCTLSDKFTLVDSSSYVSIVSSCALATDLDSMGYGITEDSVMPEDPKQGKAIALCGECTAASCADSTESWRYAQASYDAAGNLGSPGAANKKCGCDAPEGLQLTPPAPGDLVITEIFANPSQSSEAKFEWFEVKVAAQGKAIDLSGLGLVKGKGEAPVATIDAAYCVNGKPGDYLVLANNADPATNGGVTADYAYGSKLSLNASGYLAIVLGTTVIAEKEYPSVENGKSLQLDEASGQWCDALAPWADGSGFGSPGEPNPSCTSCFRGGVLGPANSPKAGEVKITEIMANAPGAEDTDKDWFEVTNFTNTDLDLNNVEIWDDTDDDKAAHLIQSDNNDCVTIPATKTVVFARVADAAKNGVDPTRVLYVYKSAALNNSGYLALKLGTNVIDEVSYADAEDGKALQKDPASGTWCDAVKQYWTATDGTPAFGTPGEGNSPCGVVFCKENGQDRPVDPPDVGTLVISEIFANPDGDEGPREWLEIYVTPEAVGKDANGLEVVLGGNSKGKLAEGGDCLPLPAGYVVIAGSADVASNGGLTAVFAAMSLSLTNGGTDMMVRYSGKIIDAVTYGNVKEQVALQLDPAALDATSNDDPKQWCDATKTYNATGDKGTPGTENPSCGETFCTDSQGQAVPVTPPKPDALVITEIYANTPGQEDANKEWFEVFVPQNSAAAHLNGVGILSAAGQPPAFSFSSDQCIELKAGQIYVFCRDIDPGTNGGVTGCIKYSSVTLTNDNGFLGLGLPGVIYDAVYDYGKTKDGISKSLDPAKWNATDNDALSNWCDTPAGNTFGNGTTLGTPGLMNPACPQG